MKIPKIIHQTWKTRDIPLKCQKWVDSWKEKNPDWEHRLWTDEDNRNLVKQYFPKFLKIYDSYSRPIYRADFARYCIVYIHGGVYADLDFECLKSLESLIENDKCFFGLEPKEHWNGKNVVCNALFGSVPRNPLFVHFMREIYKRTMSMPYAVAPTLTGPKMITNVIKKLKPSDTNIYASPVFYPECAMNDSKIPNKGKLYLKGKEQLANAYATHHWMKSWIKGNKC